MARHERCASRRRQVWPVKLRRRNFVTEHILVEKAEKLLVLTLNRPEKKNALTRAMDKTLAHGDCKRGYRP